VKVCLFIALVGLCGLAIAGCIPAPGGPQATITLSEAIALSKSYNISKVVLEPTPDGAFGLLTDEDEKPTRVGSLERDKPTCLFVETLEHRSRAGDIPRPKCRRGGAALVAPRQARREPWRDENPREDRLQPLGLTAGGRKNGPSMRSHP
jgi:hypothetical protein